MGSFIENLFVKGLTDLIEAAKSRGVTEAFVDECLQDFISEPGQQAQRDAFIDGYEPEPPDVPNLD